MENDSTFQRISSLLTVVEIAQPIIWSFDTSQSLREIYDWTADRDDVTEIFLITKQGAPHGFLDYFSDFEPENISKVAGDVMTPLETWRVVGAQTSIFDLIPLWPRSYYYFVLTGTKISHFVSRRDMDSFVVKSTLFSLTAELEARLLLLLLKDRSAADRRFRLLGSEAQTRSRGISERKGMVNCAYSHIQNTYFAEKARMIVRSRDLCETLPFETVDAAKIFFSRINNLRNELAHGGSLFNAIQDASELHDIFLQTETVLKYLPATHR